jgi:fatty acid desaturase
MKALMQRHDGPAIRDTLIWLALLVLSGAWGVVFWGQWQAWVCFAVYGVLYGSACDSRWHECGHGTAFRTPWMNDAVYHIASVMVMRNPVSWRYSHARHHTDTIIVGRDPEIALMRPADLARGALHFIGLPDVFAHFAVLLRNAFGRFGGGELDYIPPTEVPRAVFWARVHVAIQGTAVVWAGAAGSVVPLLLIGGPRIYGCCRMAVWPKMCWTTV